MRRSHLILASLIATLAASPGCGGGNTLWITGKLLKGGSQYVPPKDQLVTITFVALEVRDQTGKTIPSGDPYLAELDQASGTFIVPGPERQGIPPGKYRVAVTQKMERTAFDAANPRPKRGVNRETDMLGDRFGLTTSPIIVEVTRSETLTLDLDRPSNVPSH